MATLVLASALRHARDSWRGQLGVLAVGAVLFALLVASGDVGVDLLPRALVASLYLLVLVALSVRMAVLRPAGLDAAHVASELLTVTLQTPRLVAQVLVAAGPAIAVSVLAMLVAGPVPLLALPLVPVAFATWLLAAPAAQLAIVAVVRGDQAWVPSIAASAVRGHPASLVGTTLVGSVVASIVALPLVLTGLVLAALVGPAGVIGTGIAAAALVPATGCWALALWEQAGLEVAVPAEAEPGAALPAPSFEAPQAPWVDGPAWNTALEAGSVWGTWVRLDTAAEIGFRLSWTGSSPPRLLLGREDGTWIDPGGFARPGAVVVTPLEAGNTYLQVASTGAIAEAITLTMLVRGAVAA